ncbi:haloacid dehalogenase-like hydrolase [Reichenbachiella agariperforans]|uniref:HAD family hydrolase n=1 Tax=Reichenbachiella TaxID=156993 RepID=UPI000932C75D|nr:MULTISPECIES: HAD family hydrolase [Reichenbachiella]MBU2912943.1 haloacid dehalogenase-like hydrolase [Reichenbachiella agariperforans]RJE72812.1 haloacid dehalogenase [Reichenbachiella sp. MSK19-1]
MKIFRSSLILVLILAIFASCQEQKKTTASPEERVVSDPLPSWNDGINKDAILTFVKAVTDSTSTDFVSVEDRIAVFDNDGTLWSEQPAYFQLFFAIDRIKAMASDHPEWKKQQPYQAILEGDMKALMASGEKGLLELVLATHTGMTTDEFETIVSDWVATAKHPRFDKPYKELVFQPMLELLAYLRANDFKTFIVSGGGIEFMRPWAEVVYGIPKDQIVGSTIKTKFEIKEGKAQIIRLPELDFIDDKAGKPVAINRFIGRKPIFAAGNSDGDLQMLQWTDSRGGKTMKLYIHHTDSVREWAYDRSSHIGQFDKGLDEALDKGWTIASMKEDWKVIYPFEMK